MPARESLDLFVASAPGLEPIVARELTSIGMRGRTEEGGVAVAGTLTDLMQLNVRLRAASRVLVRVGSFRATAFHELERAARRLAWERFLSSSAAAQLRVTCRKSRLYHSDAVAERIAGAIVRATNAHVELRAEEGDESVQERQLFVVRVVRDRVTISADSSGTLLHRRGYRQAVAKAPLRESLAAAMLIAAGYDGSIPLLDPFCGSGTIPIEGAMIARRIAPGALRARHGDFAFVRWPGFDDRAWDALRSTLETEAVPRADVSIRGSDRDAGAVRSAADNAARAGVAESVEFRERALSRAAVPEEPGLVATNPPYGARIGDHAALRDLYDAFARLLHERLRGWRYAILSPGGELESRLRLRPAEVYATGNGGIPVRLITGSIP